MKRPLKPVTQTDEERRRERKFTRRLLLLATAGSLFGLGVQLVTHTMGRPPTPAGAPPPPTLTVPTPGVAPPPPVPKLPGK